MLNGLSSSHRPEAALIRPARLAVDGNMVQVAGDRIIGIDLANLPTSEHDRSIVGRFQDSQTAARKIQLTAIS